MKVKITNTDKRFGAFPHFKYCVTPHRNRSEFFEFREWLWQTYGPSKELREWIDDLNKHSYAFYGPVTHHNQHWCWNSDTYNRRIFLCGDQELALLKLRFE